MKRLLVNSNSSHIISGSSKLLTSVVDPIAYEGFNYFPGTYLNRGTSLTNALYGGYGWLKVSPPVLNNNYGWYFQGGSGVIKNSSQLEYSTGSDVLLRQNNYLDSASFYATCGRRVDNTIGGRFDTYLNGSSRVGLDGTTLYFSVLLRKDANNNESLFICTSPNDISWVGAQELTINNICFGYLNDNEFRTGGIMKWGIRLGGVNYISPTDLISSKTVTIGETVLFVVQIDYNTTGNNIYGWINPTLLPIKPAADVSGTWVADISFKSLSLTTGTAQGSGSVDEIRVGATWESVIPYVSGSTI